MESSPTIVDGTVYIGDEAGLLYAIDADDGELLWSGETNAQIRVVSQVVDGTVYVGSTDHSVYAFDAASGTVQWEFPTGSLVNSSPTRVGDTVYVGSEDNNLYALNADDGTEQWRFKANGMITNAPTVVDGIVYVGSRDQSVYAIDADDGTERWSYRTDLWISSEVTVVNGTAYVGSDDSTLYAFDAADGRIEWQFTEPEAHLISATTVHDGVVYVASDDETFGRADHPTPAVLYAVDANDGEKLWEFAVEVPEDTDEAWQFHASPTVADGVVYIANVNGTVYGIDADTGELTWEFETGDAVWCSPTVVDGVLYVGSDDEHLYAIDLETTASSEDSRVALGTLGHHDEWGAPSTDDALSAEIWARTYEPEPGQGVAINGLPDEETITHEWDAPQAENFPESGQAINHTFADEGRYAVTLTVTNANGETDPTTTTFVVGDPADSDSEEGDPDYSGSEDDDPADTETAVESGDDATDDSVPGLGIISAVASLGGAGYLLSRRASDSEER